MFDYKLVAISLIAFALLYTAFVKPYLTKRNLLTNDMLDLIDYACERGVGYAEQMYKTDQAVNRKELAMEFTFDVIRKAGIIPDKYLGIIIGIIEDKVRELPPTHDYEDVETVDLAG